MEYLRLECPVRIELEGHKYNNALSAWLSFKDKEKNKAKYSGLTGQEAREKAAKIKSNADWEDRKLHYLYKVNVAKFEHNAFFRQMFVQEDLSKIKNPELRRVLELTQQYFVTKKLQEQNAKIIQYEIIKEFSQGHF